MVYELCVEASQYLAKFNVKKFTSFAEEREEHQKREAAQKEEGKKNLERIKRDAVAAKIAQRKLEIFEEQKRLKEEEDMRRTSVEDSGVFSGLTCHPGVRQRRRMTESDEIQDGVKELLLSVKGEKVNVVRGRILGVNRHQQKTYLGFCTGAGSVIALSRWLVHSKSKKNRKVKFDDMESDVGKALASLEHEMNSLQKLKHPNLVSYLGLTFSTKDEGTEAYLAQEFISGVDLSGYLSGTRMMDLDMIRQVCEDILFLTCARDLAGSDARNELLEAMGAVVDEAAIVRPLHTFATSGLVQRTLDVPGVGLWAENAKAFRTWIWECCMGIVELVFPLVRVLPYHLALLVPLVLYSLHFGVPRHRCRAPVP